jgi:hypothetical protein
MPDSHADLVEELRKWKKAALAFARALAEPGQRAGQQRIDHLDGLLMLVTAWGLDRDEAPAMTWQSIEVSNGLIEELQELLEDLRQAGLYEADRARRDRDPQPEHAQPVPW